MSGNKVVMAMLFVLCLVPVERVSGGSLRGLHFLQTPSDTTARRGEEVILQCSAGPRDSVTDCGWTRDGLGLSMDHMTRYTMRGCNLHIQPLQLEDEGSYKCQVGGHGMEPILSPPATLQVMVEPGRPSILEAREGDWVEVEQGDELLLTCESHGGRPHAEIQWKDKNDSPVMGNAVEHVTRIGNTNSFKTVSVLRFNPLEPMTVTCTAHSEGFPEVRRSRDLMVQLRKKVEEEEVTVRNGDNIQLTCGTDTGIYKWFLNDREVEGETGNTLDIEDFTGDYDNSVVKCLQEKFGGESRLLKLVRLKLERQPPRRTSRNNVEEPEDEGSGVEQNIEIVTSSSGKKKTVFTCVAELEEDTAPQFVWVNGRLERQAATARDTQGRGYKCKLVKGGMKKVKQMEKKLKGMAKDLRKFSKILSGFTAPNKS